MRKLLRAEFSYLRLMKLFWAELLALIGYGLLIVIGGYDMAVKCGLSLEGFAAESLFQHASLLGIMGAVLDSLLVGTDYSDGIIRNKLVVGRSRTQIYLSNFIACAAAGAVQLFFASAVIWTFIMLLMGRPQIGAPAFLSTCIVMLFLCVSYASIYNFVSMLVSGKAYASILNILLAVAFLITASFLLSKLAIPETMQPYAMGANPYYVSGVKRRVYQFFADFLPAGQTLQMADLSLVWKMPGALFRYCGLSAAIAVILNTAGIILFRHKDLK